MIQVYISQVVAIAIAVYFGKHDAPAVNYFANYGVDKATQGIFHRAGFRLKIAVVTGLSAILLFPFSPWNLLQSFIAGLINAGWVFLLFDPVLNKARKLGLSWSYLSSDDNIGAWLIKRFGKRAGEVKAIVCILVIVLLNVLLYFLNKNNATF